MAFANIICTFIEGRRRDYNEADFIEMIDNMKYTVSNLSGPNPLNYYPSLIHLPGDLFKGKEIARRVTKTFESFKIRYIRDKHFTHTEGKGYDCFVDAYMKEMAKEVELSGESILDEQNLERLILDLYAAGTETSSTTTLWLILHLLHNPHVQQKIHNEIDEVIGQERIPSMLDKPKLPYLNATIMEVQRIASIVPLSVLHRTSENISFRGYNIPKGTYISPNLDSVLHDPEIWGEDVDVFRPERHLNEQGKMVTRSEFIPFSVGRRICLGEGLAKMELFLFAATLLQMFTFQPAQTDSLPSLDVIYGTTVVPHSYQVKVVPRH